MFSGTSIIAKEAMKFYNKVILNDILYSNNIIYQAFYKKENWNYTKIIELISEYNALNPNDIEENYFSKILEESFLKMI